MADILGLVVSLLDTNWNAGNTDGLKPSIKKIMLADKTLDLQISDQVLVYAIDYLTAPAGLGATQKATTDDISIDIRVAGSDQETQGRTHAVKVRDEVERILDSSILNPFSGYDLLTPMSVKDFSDKFKSLHRFVFDVKIQRISTARGVATGPDPSGPGEFGTLVKILLPP